jgi:beta-1,4-mannosyl-glycoprotein beta-1,4-N-acetylglucosaminyltransferase
MKIIDAFTFYNEIDMLRFRLDYLAGFVDHFVLAESRTTFSGSPKELFFEANKHKFDGYPIVHVVDEPPETDDPWVRERHQRDSLMGGVLKLEPVSSDIVVLTDVDEIPDRNRLVEFRAEGLAEPVCLEMDTYYYSPRCKYMAWRWCHPKALPFAKVAEVGSMESCRFIPARVLPRGGWHFSYFGNEDFIANKIRSFSHQEYNTNEFTNAEHIKSVMENGKDLYGRHDDFKIIELSDNDYLPENVDRLICGQSADS